MPNVTGFTRPTVLELIDRLQADVNARIPSADARLPNSVLDGLAKSLAGELHLMYGFLTFIAQQTMVDTSRLTWLSRHASIWGIVRRPASFAGGNVTFTGSDGVVIPKDTIVQRQDGVQFVIGVDTAIGVSGTVDVAVSALLPGSMGNTDPLTQASLVTPVVGVDTAGAVASSGISGGSEPESDEDLLERLLLRIQQPPHGGIANDYRQWALEVPGVTRVWVYPNEMGVGTVTVRFVKDGKLDTIVPDALEVAEVQAVMELRRPVTAQVFVVAPNLVPLDFSLNVHPDTPAVRAAVEVELADLLIRDASPGVTIFLSRVHGAIDVATGEIQHTIFAPTDNFSFSGGDMPVLGTVTWVP